MPYNDCRSFIVLLSSTPAQCGTMLRAHSNSIMALCTMTLHVSICHDCDSLIRYARYMTLYKCYVVVYLAILPVHVHVSAPWRSVVPSHGGICPPSRGRRIKKKRRPRALSHTPAGKPLSISIRLHNVMSLYSTCTMSCSTMS